MKLTYSISTLEIQERSSRYVEDKGRELVELLCNGKGAMSDLIEVGTLKLKERDELVDVFHSWKQNVPFDAIALRDQRLRHLYATRYDYRVNLVDWDYTMILKKIEGTSIIHNKQYREWRNSGIAFEFGDQTYTVPNRSLSSFALCKEQGRGSTMRRGFWADISTGPYISHGLDCYKPNKFAHGLFDILSKGTGCEQHRHNAVEVCVYNILSFLYEIETGEIYCMKKEHEIYSGIGDDEESNQKQQNRFSPIHEEMCEDKSEDKRSTDDQNSILRAQTIVETFSGIKIFLLTGDFERILMKKRFAKIFNRVYIGFQAAHLIATNKEGRSLNDIFDDSALITVETPIYMIPLTTEQKILGLKKIHEYAIERSWQPKFAFSGQANVPEKQDAEDARAALLNYKFER